MKRILLSLSLLISTNYICSMDNDTAAPAAPQTTDDLAPLTAEEKNLFNWFEGLAIKDPSYFNGLPTQDQEVLKQKIKYPDNPELVRRSRASMARSFLAQASKKNIELKCDEKALTLILVKVAKELHAPKSEATAQPTDLLSARTYVWSQLMTEEQRSAWCKEMYDANPQKVETVTSEWSLILAKKLAEIGLIEKTEAAIALKAQELFNEKWALLQKMYTHTAAVPSAQ